MIDPAISDLAAWVRRAADRDVTRTFMLGIVGPPGAGKSTLAEKLVQAVGLVPSACLSLDDFYLEPSERQAAGRTFRGPPGTHDLALLDRFLRQIRAPRTHYDLPVYDREREHRLPSRTVPGPLRLCVLEGWFVGARAPGYEPLADAIDLLIYLDMDVQAARHARLHREAALRAQGRGGMSDDQVARFWDEALAPHLHTLLPPLRARADAVLRIDAAHRITTLTLGELSLHKNLP